MDVFSAYGTPCAKCGVEIRYLSGSWANCERHKHGAHEECGSTHSRPNQTIMAVLRLDRFQDVGGPA